MFEWINLILSIITTFAALFLSYIALKHTAKPRIEIQLLNDLPLKCGSKSTIKFYIKNMGYFYAKPMVINLEVFFNFSVEFNLDKILYGSILEKSSNRVRTGAGNMVYIMADGIMLAHKESGEEVHIKTKVPKIPDKYLIKVTAFSENGVSFTKDYHIKCE